MQVNWSCPFPSFLQDLNVTTLHRPPHRIRTKATLPMNVHETCTTVLYMQHYCMKADVSNGCYFGYKCYGCQLPRWYSIWFLLLALGNGGISWISCRCKAGFACLPISHNFVPCCAFRDSEGKDTYTLVALGTCGASVRSAVWLYKSGSADIFKSPMVISSSFNESTHLCCLMPFQPSAVAMLQSGMHHCIRFCLEKTPCEIWNVQQLKSMRALFCLQVNGVGSVHTHNRAKCNALFQMHLFARICKPTKTWFNMPRHRFTLYDWQVTKLCCTYWNVQSSKNIREVIRFPDNLWRWQCQQRYTVGFTLIFFFSRVVQFFHSFLFVC